MMNSIPIFDTITHLLLGTTIAALLGIVLSYFCRTATEQARIWRLVTCILLALSAIELSGLREGFSSVIRRELANVTESKTRPRSNAIPPEIVSMHEVLQPAPDPLPAPDHIEDFAADVDSDELLMEWLEPATDSPESSEFDSDSTGLPILLDDVAPPLPPSPEVSTQEPTKAMDYDLAVVLIWTLGTVVCVLRTSVMYIRSSRIHRKLEAAEGEVQSRLDDVRARLGFKNRVYVCTHRSAVTPYAFGFWRPTIVIPREFSKLFSPQQQVAILAHELTHLASFDGVWHTLIRACVATLWWSPGTWYALRRLKSAAELAADESSLYVPDGPQHLADCLVKAGRLLSEKQRFAVMGMSGNETRSGLAARVKRLLTMSSNLNGPRNGKRLHGVIYVGVFSLFLLTSILPSVVARAEQPIESGDTNMRLLKQSWQRSFVAGIAAAFLAPSAIADEDRVENIDKEVEIVLELSESDDEGVEIRRRVRGGERAESSRERPRTERRIRIERRGDGGEEHREEIHFRTRSKNRAEALEQARNHLRNKYEELKREGINPEIERELQNQIRHLDVEVELVAQHEREARERRSSDQRRDQDRREHHIRQAIENLHAAGLHEHADRLAHELARDSQRESHYREPARRDSPRSMARPVTRSNNSEINRFRSEMATMRDQMAEMREMMHMLMEQHRSRDRENDRKERSRREGEVSEHGEEGDDFDDLF